MKTSEELNYLNGRVSALEELFRNQATMIRNVKAELYDKMSSMNSELNQKSSHLSITHDALAVIAQYNTNDVVDYFGYKECTIEQTPLIADCSIIRPMILRSGKVLIPIPNEHLKYISPCQQQH